jgi:GGDEF domain-containing protein
VTVLSIRKYLTDCGTESTNPYLQVCTMLLKGIARTALAWDRVEYAEFCATLEGLASTLETSQEADELLAVASGVKDALENYNRGAQNVHAAQTVELRCMIEMLSQTLVALAQAGTQSIQRLQSIRSQVETARQLDDIRLLRARLGDTLKAISDEARMQRELSTEMLRHAQEAASVALGHRADPDTDRVSGLPSPEKAEAEIAAKAGPGSPYFAVVFVVERVNTLNLNYGYSAGDQLLHAFGQHLKDNLARNNNIFRWRGPAIMAMLQRSCAIDKVKEEVTHFAARRPEHVMQIGGRTVKLPMTCSWSIVELAKCELAGKACQEIDHFVAEHWEKRD